MNHGDIHDIAGITPSAAQRKEVGLATAVKGDRDGMPPAHQIPKFNLTLHLGSNFPSWRDQWDGYIKAVGLAGYSVGIQRVAVSHAMETETLTYIRGLCIPDDHTCSQVLDRLEQSLCGIVSMKVERTNLCEEAEELRDDRHVCGRAERVSSVLPV